MLKRIVIVLAPLIFAALCAAFAYAGYVGVAFVWLDNVHFFNYHYPLAHLICASAALAIAIVLFVRARSIPALLFMSGTIGLLGATLHDCFISWGLSYHWFQFGGTDGWVFRGFFEPQENAILLFIRDFFKAMVVLAYVGIFWLAAQFTRKHLTKRWSFYLL